MNTSRYSEVEISHLPAMRVAAHCRVSQSPEEEGQEYMRRWLVGQKISGPVRLFGFDIEVSPQEAEAGWRGYETWMAVPEHASASQEVVIKHFPGGLYAVMKIFNPFEDPFEWIPAGWQKLAEWVDAHDQYAAEDRLGLEELVVEDGVENLILYFPVQPA
jgi:DNA gyrase inhibitor GyrI